jgi:hypothetical protein
MNKTKWVLFALLSIIVFASCSNTETYADQKNKERAAIKRYIANKNIKVIDEEQFFAQDSTTDVSKNEFVLFESSGVYMQIIRKGNGEKLKPEKDGAIVLCRFNEYNLLESDSTLILTNILQYVWLADKMSVTSTSGTYSASFIKGSSLMYTTYGEAVPSGWLVPMPYINLGGLSEEGVAKVKLIVPHTEGQQTASSNVYPCLYELTYQRGR